MKDKSFIAISISSLLIISLLASFISCKTEYHGYLSESNGKYIGQFAFDESKLPLNTTQYESFQLRYPEKLNSTLIKNITINLQIEYEKYIHIKVTDTNDKDRWEVPTSEIISPNYSYNLENNIGSPSSKYKLIFTNNSDIFSFELQDKNSQKTFYTFSNETFLFTDRYINFESILTSNDIFGFGERFHNIKLGNGIFTIWPNDTGGIKEDSGEGGKNGYSHQPVAIHKTIYENIWLGFVFINTNNQDVVIQNYGNDLTSLQHKTIGGIIDYYIIVDSSPVEVIKDIHNLLGHPFLPPYWSLGSQQCRYGYNKLSVFEDVYNNYDKYKLPLDTMWIDIDSLDNFQIFTLNKEEFAELPNFIDKIHQEHRHFVPIVDIGIAYTENCEFAKLGDELNIFLKSNYTKKNMVIKVWPGDTVIPDFFNPNSSILWDYGLNKYQDLVHYDGIWLDMNEVANLNKEAKCIGEEAEVCNKEDNFYYYDDLPYMPGYDGKERINMASGTINENGIIYGKNETKYAVYNTKPLLPFLEGKNTYNFLKGKLNVRPFILTRSATIGSGKYTAHWLGDNHANYDSMRNSLNGIFQFDIFGMPMTGDDICGFFDDSYSTLCNRWYNLGAFYAFSRNHNFIDSIDQYPWSFNDQATLDNIRQAVNYRYSLLRYIYSYLFSVSLNEKVGFFNPVFFSFPNEANSYTNIDEKAMIGDAFILFPVFTDSTDNFNVNFPSGKWNAYPSGKLIKNFDDVRNSELSGSLDIIHLYMRGGFIVPYQNSTEYIKNSYMLKNDLYTNLIINPNEEHKAKGVMFFDDDGIYTIEENYYERIDLVYEKYTLYINNTHDPNYSYKQNDFHVGVIEIWGETIEKNNLFDNYKNLYSSDPLCNITIYAEGKTEGPFSMEADYENDKFYYDLKKLSFPFDELVKIEFNFYYESVNN